MNAIPTKVFAFITDTEIAHCLYVAFVVSGLEACCFLAVNEPIFQAKKFHRSNTNCMSIYSELLVHFINHSFIFGLALRWQLLILDWWRHQVKLAGAYYSCVVKWKIARQNHVSLLPLFQDESTCTIQMIIRFTRSHARFHVNQTHFHLNGFALGLVFKRRQKATRK